MRFLGIDNSLRTRIIVFCSGLLIAVQVAAFFIVNTTSLNNAAQRAIQELESGNRVFQRLLSYHTDQLINASVVLSADFGFRRAVATGDAETIRSVLENHGSRIGADLMMLLTPDDRVIANTRGADTLPPSLGALLAQAKLMGRATSHVVIDHGIYRATVLPVLAPDVVGWVVVGFAVDKAFAEELKALTNLQISFVKVTGGDVSVLFSSLPDDEQRNLQAEFSTPEALFASLGEPTTSHGLYFTRTVELPPAGSDRTFAVLQRPIADTYRQLSQLRQLLIVLAVISIVLSIVGIALIANSVTRPLRTLARVAEKIKAGDYSSAANIAEQGEIGMLAESFNLMRDSMSTLLRLAYRDPLTNLPNRAMFNDRMDQAIKLAHRRQENFTLLFIDLNKFKAINDTYGHEAGDIVLKQVSRRLEESVRETDTVARLGGDEFAIIVLSDDRDVIDRIVEKIQGLIDDHPIDVGGASVSIGCSIGAASYPDQGHTMKDLMRHADKAMYAVKHGKAPAEPCD